MLHIHPNLDKIQLYNRLKLDLADQIRIVGESLLVLGFEKKQKQILDLMVKLAEDRFMLTILGLFKRGKSTLLNAITGSEIFPTGVLPLTSSIAIVKYGPKERMVVDREGFSFPEEKQISLLSQFVTENGNPGNIKKVKSVSVEIPLPFLKYGFELVDTPGVGSAIIANTETTYKFLPECDAVIFVTSVDTPMVDSELNFLADINRHAKRIFFVVNKVDLLSEQELKEALAFICKKIGEVTGLDSPKIFPMSAQQGLQSRLINDESLYKSSGLKDFEEELATFLSDEKLMDFIGIICKKTLSLISDLCEEQLGVDVEQGYTNEKSKEALIALGKAFEKIKLMYHSINNDQNADFSDVVVKPKDTAPIDISFSKEELSIDFDLDISTRGCPICQYITKFASLFFAQWQFRLASNEDAQHQFANELGFCPVHTWQLVAMTSLRGASIGFNKLAQEMCLRIEDKNSNFSDGRYVRSLIHDYQNCNACKVIGQHELDYIVHLAAKLNQREFREKYEESQGACLKHLGMLLDCDLSQESREFLLSHTSHRFTSDADDMRSYALKSDTLLKQQQNSNEKDAYLRAIIRIVGDRNTVMPWKL